MPKYIIKNEQILNEFMGKFFKAIGRKKGQKFVKALFKDPELQSMMRDAQDIADDILDHIKEKDVQLARDLKKRYGY
jgi:pantoate kinase